jgi:hypothetical protein
MLVEATKYKEQTWKFGQMRQGVARSVSKITIQGRDTFCYGRFFWGGSVLNWLSPYLIRSLAESHIKKFSSQHFLQRQQCIFYPPKYC